MKAPLRLIVEGREPMQVVAYACAVCGVVSKTETAASECCGPRHCDCGAVIEKEYHYTACAPCRSKADALKDAARYEKAKKVRESDPAVTYLYCECCSEYFETSGDLFERHWDDAMDLPLWAWACDRDTLALDAVEIVSRELEDGEFHEDASESIEAGAYLVLQASMDDFCDAQDIHSFFPSNTVVLLEEERAAFPKEHPEEEVEAES